MRIEDLDEEEIMQIFREKGLTKEKQNDDEFEKLFKGIECMNSFYVFSKVSTPLIDNFPFIEKQIPYSIVQHLQALILRESNHGCDCTL